MPVKAGICIMDEGNWLNGLIPFAASRPSQIKRYTSSERLGKENKSSIRNAKPAINKYLKFVSEKKRVKKKYAANKKLYNPNTSLKYSLLV